MYTHTYTMMMYNNIEKLIPVIEKKLQNRNDIHYGAAIIYGKQKYCEKGDHWDKSQIETAQSNSKHAEIDALEKYLRRSDIKQKQVDLLVLGFNRRKEVRLSRPCYHCLLHLEHSNIKIRHVYYRTAVGVLVRESFHSMLDSSNTHICRGNMYGKRKYSNTVRTSTRETHFARILLLSQFH